MSELSAIEERIGYRFRDPQLLQTALTHPSALIDGTSSTSNQRLEFLGDAVLELVISEKLYSENPAANEGQMTTLRASLVRGPSLAALARDLSLGGYLILSQTARDQSTQESLAVLEDALEAIFGAVYLDGGLEAARNLLVQLFSNRDFDAEAFESEIENPKGALQEKVQADPTDEEQPIYEIVLMEGPPHNRLFESTVCLRGELLGRGQGSSKKAAETEAARQALDNLNKV